MPCLEKSDAQLNAIRGETLYIDKKTAPNGMLYDSYSALSKNMSIEKMAREDSRLKVITAIKNYLKEFSYNGNNISSIFFLSIHKNAFRDSQIFYEKRSVLIVGQKKYMRLI